MELFSFGSGGWKEGTEGNEIMGDPEGKWINMALDSDNARIILETKGLSQRLLEGISTEVVMSFKDMMLSFEGAGELKISFISHTVEKEGMVYKVSRRSVLAFLLESNNNPAGKMKKACCLPVVGCKSNPAHASMSKFKT